MKDQRTKQIVSTFAFLRSVIASGEPMTEEVRSGINEAIRITKEIDNELNIEE